MPLTLVCFSDSVSLWDKNLIIEALPGIIASNLNLPGCASGQLTPEEVEVFVVPQSGLHIIHRDVNVVVLANDFEARKANGQERSDNMREALKKLLPAGLTGFVWVLLAPGFYAEF